VPQAGIPVVSFKRVYRAQESGNNALITRGRVKARERGVPWGEWERRSAKVVKVAQLKEQTGREGECIGDIATTILK